MPSKIVRRGLTVAAALAVGALASCSYFDRGSSSCNQHGASKCVGRNVLVCTPDYEASVDEGELALAWSKEQTCKDDAQLGSFTCGYVAGRASCIPGTAEPQDPATPRPMPLHSWLQVTVARESTMRIVSVTAYELATDPPDPAWGVAAAVSSINGQIVDATLVPVLDSASREATVWLRDDGADRVTLVDDRGMEMASFERAKVEKVRTHRSIEGTRQALEAPWFKTMELVARFGDDEVEVHPRVLAIMQAALERVPADLLLVSPKAILRLDLESRYLADEPSQRQEQPASWLPDRSRVARHELLGSSLHVDMSGQAVREYENDPKPLAADIIRTLGETYLRFADVAGARAAHEQSAADSFLTPKLPSDFPPSLEPYLMDRHASLLAAGETLGEAWHGLHDIAVSSRLALPYGGLAAAAIGSDEEAVRAGFASRRGSVSTEKDFAEYLALANVPELWTVGPCTGLRKDVDQIAPAELVALAKLLALRGLGFLDGSRLAACAGVLGLSSAKPGLVLFKPNAERIELTDHAEGLRQPYFGEEEQLSWSARRSYLTVTLTLSYRGDRPTVMRLAPVGGHSGKDGRVENDYSAIFAATNPNGYQTTVATAGLVVVTKVDQKALEGYALMVKLKEPLGGVSVFPLVAARVKKPLWGEEP